MSRTVEHVEVAYFHRAAGIGVSHERLYRAVASALPADLQVRQWRAPAAGNDPLSMIRNAVSARRARGQINHILAGALGYLAFVLRPERTILTIHDCAGLNGLAGMKRLIYQLLWYKWPIRRVKWVVAISDSTRQQLCTLFPEYSGKIRVIGNCLPPGFEPCPKKFEAGKPVILQVGTKPNKNVLRVAEALVGVPCHLRIVGPLPVAARDLLKNHGIEYSNAANLSDEQMLSEYRACDMVMFASTYEGFGMPIIEAQAIGRPVVVSDREPMRSVAGEGACLADPENSASIRDAVVQLIENDTYREGCVAAGIVNAGRFSAGAVGEQYAQIYRQLVQQ